MLLFLALTLSCVSALPWLDVCKVDKSLHPASPRDYVICDNFSREVTLRGACVESEERSLPPWQRSTSASDYASGACPDNNGNYQEPPICGVQSGAGKFNQDTSALSRNDFAQVRALGFNIVRLCLSWSSLEYTPGVYNASYIERVAQMVSWAEEQDVYVILDMHEDLYSLFIQPTPNTTGVPGLLSPGGGQDGAPAWAVATDGWPPLSIFGIGNLNLAIMRAFDNFYLNTVVPGIPQGAAPGPGLQDHYIGAIAALAARFANSSTVAGFEIINEPNPGTALGPLHFGRSLLYPLYTRVVQAVTGVRDGLPPCAPGLSPYAQPPTCAYPDLGLHDTRHLFFAEPSALRNELDFSAEEIPGPWTTYPRIVHTPHVYTHVFTIDVEVPALNLTGKWPPSWAFAYDSAWREANRMQAPVFVTEFGTGETNDDSTVLPTLDQAELHGTGGTIWSWKSGCGTDPTSDWCNKNISWTIYAPAVPIPGSPNASLPPNGPLYAHRERLMSRVHSRGTLGEELGRFYNVTERSFVLVANCSAAQAAAGRGAAGGAWAAGVAAALGAGSSSGAWGAAQDAALAAAAAANGSVTEVYLPRSIPAAAANASVLSGAAVALGVLQWPDGSRSAFFAPTAPGVYTLGVPPSQPSGLEGLGGGSSSSSSSSRTVLVLGQGEAAGQDMAEQTGRLMAALPQLGDMDRAREAAEGMGSSIVQQRAELIRQAALVAGYEI